MTAADDRADQIRARLAAATPGPWERYGNMGFHVFTVAYTDHAEDYEPPEITHGSDREQDADLIANAPADLAFLLAERTELLRRVEQAERAGAVGGRMTDEQRQGAARVPTKQITDLRGADLIRTAVVKALRWAEYEDGYIVGQRAEAIENGADL